MALGDANGMSDVVLLCWCCACVCYSAQRLCYGGACCTIANGCSSHSLFVGTTGRLTLHAEKLMLTVAGACLFHQCACL